MLCLWLVNLEVGMENLILNCVYGSEDRIILEQEGLDINITVINEENPDSVIILTRDKANQLRSWLNKVLGESK